MANFDEKKENRLLIQLQKNPSKGFEMSYDAYSDKLLHFIFTKTGDKSLSEDLLQDVFVEFWNNKDKINSSIYAFLFQITKFKIFNYYRSEKVKNQYILHLNSFLQDSHTFTPHKGLEIKEMMSQIESLVEKLPPKCRRAFILSRFEHKTNDEIAETLQISKRTVENYITKSLAFIRENDIYLYLIFFLFMRKH